MRSTFRQSMIWLHTWTGLLVGWILYFVFLTGTLGYVSAEIDRWMRPEQPLLAGKQATANMVILAERRLREQASDAELWQIRLPGGRGNAPFFIGWRDRPAGNVESGKFQGEVLDQETGLPVERAAHTGGGNVLYRMHYLLHYMPKEWGILVVGICTMFMLVAILTGIVAHKKILREFFTFRPGKGQRSWLDGHNLLAVTALPFHLMITWSGLVFFLFTYMPVALDALYPPGPERARFFSQADGIERVESSAARPVASLTPLAPLLRQAETRWGGEAVAYINIDNPGRDNARITFYARDVDVSRNRPRLRFDGVTGRLTDDRGSGATLTVPGLIAEVLYGLHEGHFAGPLLRLFYVLSGLAGTAMIGTGLLLWSTKRKAKLRKTDKPHFGIAAVDVLNIGTIVGLPIGIAAYFWANRLLPSGMADRAAWEVHVMFITWGLSFCYAMWRPGHRAWLELSRLAAVAFGLLPLLNVLTSERHLGITIQAQDWGLASIDLGMFAAGALFAFVVRSMLRHKETAGPATKVRLSAAGPAPGNEAKEARLLSLPLAIPRGRGVAGTSRRRWSFVLRLLAAVAGGYTLTSLLNIALPLLLGATGASLPQALLTTTMASFLVYAAVIMAVFHARSARRSWAWLLAASLPLAAVTLLLLPGAAP